MQCPQKVRHYLGAFFMGRKVKYPLEFKVGCVEEVLKCHRTIGSVAATNGCDESKSGNGLVFIRSMDLMTFYREGTGFMMLISSSKFRRN
jgi:hypothetical protein